MTRINVGMRPQDLTNKHLIAEHREIKRVPNLVSRGRYNIKSTPSEFKLGEGHVAFFYNKLLYLKKRYESIYEECLNRGFNVQYYGNAWEGIPEEMMNDYTPSERDRLLIEERIASRLKR